MPEPLGSSSSRLNYVLKGIQRMSPSPNKSRRLPITPHLLERIHALWSKDQLSFNKTMLWAAFCSPSGNPSDYCTLTVSDVQVDSRTNPQMLSILLRRSKTGPFGTGIYLYIGKTGTVICPVSALLAYGLTWRSVYRAQAHYSYSRMVLHLTGNNWLPTCVIALTE